MVARLLRPELEDVAMKNRVATAKLSWQPRGYDPAPAKWLHRIDVPTLLLWGANDRLFPKDYAFAFQRLISGIESGHHSRMRTRAACGEAGDFRRRAATLHRRHEGRGMKFFNFHLMPYRHADLDAIERNGSAWVTFSNRHYDPQKGAELYHDYLDQMEFADKLGFDGVCLNEHHQTAYGMMPIPGVLAGALARSVKRAKLAILGRALPLLNNPLMVAEEYAMLDNLTRGRFIAGFVRGIGAEYHAMGINPVFSQERFAEAHDLIVRAWTEPGPFAYEGKHYQFNYVNPWPRPYQNPHPPIWIPSQGSSSTIKWAAAMRYTYCQTLSPIATVARFFQMYRDEAESRLPGLARSARVVEHDLCRRHRREGDARGEATPRSAGQPVPEDAGRDAAAARLHQYRIDETRARRQGHRQDHDRSTNWSRPAWSSSAARTPCARSSPNIRTSPASTRR